MTQHTTTSESLSRRAFVRGGSLLLAGTAVDWAACARLLADDDGGRPRVRVGLVTDLHFADKAAAGSRFYRETIDKFAKAAGQFEKSPPDFVVELGDFIDAADSVATEKAYLARINREFVPIARERHYVLGNHCVQTLTKEEFLGGVEQEKSYYSFDAGGYHFVVLDACFRKDGEPYGRQNFEWNDANVPPAEIEWLRADLQAAKQKTIVFAHQRLDAGGDYLVKNAAAVRKVLEESGNVLAVIQGHNHINDYRQIGGIHYCTLMAMVEGTGEANNAFATMEVLPGDAIRIKGFYKQKSYAWA